MLSRSGKNGNSCLVLDHREKGFRLSPLNMMLAMGFSYMAFIMLRKFPSIPSLLSVFYDKRVLDFVKCFSTLIEMIMWVFSPFIKHSYAGFCVDISFQFIWINTKKCDCWGIW